MNQPAPVETFRLLDRLAANAWPAQVQQRLEGWRLRATGGVTRRANSVLTADPVPSVPHWLNYIEDFYARHGLPARFQVSDGSPVELDRFLAGQGYRTEAHTDVFVASAKTVISLAGETGPLAMTHTQCIDERWLDAFMTMEGLPRERRATYSAIYSAIGPPGSYLRIDEGGQAVGVGLAVCERGWTGLFSIATAPEFRRRGIATRIVGRLAQWGLGNGAPNLYLQVMTTNENAARLYATLGFYRLYGYHYRTKE